MNAKREKNITLQASFVLMSPDDEPRRIQSADRVCDILKHRRETGRTTVSELAEAIGSTTGTAHTYLAMLESRGLVRKHEGGNRTPHERIRRAANRTGRSVR